MKRDIKIFKYMESQFDNIDFVFSAIIKKNGNGFAVVLPRHISLKENSEIKLIVGYASTEINDDFMTIFSIKSNVFKWGGSLALRLKNLPNFISNLYENKETYFHFGIISNAETKYKYYKIDEKTLRVELSNKEIIDIDLSDI